MASSQPAANRGERRRAESDADAVLHACRLLVAISVRSLSAADDIVTLPELRVLVVLASRGPVSLSRVAQATGLHLSKASRMCDRLAGRGLLLREDDPDDRRSLQLTLTAAGERVVERVQRARQAAVVPLLEGMDPNRRAQLTELLEELSSAGDAADEDLWKLAWVT